MITSISAPVARPAKPPVADAAAAGAAARTFSSALASAVHATTQVDELLSPYGAPATFRAPFPTGRGAKLPADVAQAVTERLDAAIASTGDAAAAARLGVDTFRVADSLTNATRQLTSSREDVGEKSSSAKQVAGFERRDLAFTRKTLMHAKTNARQDGVFGAGAFGRGADLELAAPQEAADLNKFYDKAKAAVNKAGGLTPLVRNASTLSAASSVIDAEADTYEDRVRGFALADEQARYWNGDTSYQLEDNLSAMRGADYDGQLVSQLQEIVHSYKFAPSRDLTDRGTSLLRELAGE